MELKASHFDTESSPSPKVAGKSKAARSRDARSNPNARNRRVNRSIRANGFVGFSAEVLRELNPRGPLESVLADHVVASAWRLKLATGRQVARDSAAFGSVDPLAVDTKRVSPSAADRAARSVTDALGSLESVRASRSKNPVSADVEPDNSPDSDFAVESNEWPIVPFSSLDESPLDEPDAIEAESPTWQDRLVFDFEISDISPVIKGTWITVGHIVSLIVDGQTWADILRSHPELIEEDIRVCVAYAIAQDQDEA